MEQLLAHLAGDYLLQNHWMASNKCSNTFKGYLSCFIHCLLYTIPFTFIVGFSLSGWVVSFFIFLSHFIIDKYGIAAKFTRLKNGCYSKTGFPEDTPSFLSTGLLIIIDNTIHIFFNYFFISLKPFLEFYI